jgi:hypothetical protein
VKWHYRHTNEERQGCELHPEIVSLPEEMESVHVRYPIVSPEGSAKGADGVAHAGMGSGTDAGTL